MDFVVRLSDLEARIADCVSKTLEGEGYELVRVKAGSDSGHALMALYIDRLDRDRAITMDDLEFLNGLLSDVLDVADTQKPFFKNSYNLEVSSPGIERPLTKQQHFEAAVGKIIRVKTDALESVPRKVEGKLSEVNSDGIQVEAIFVPYARMKEANEVYNWGKAKKSKGDK